MISLLHFLADNGRMLLGGLTLLLTLATIVVAIHRAPIHRQRLAEFSMLLCLLWIILACIPLPRFMPNEPAAPASQPLPPFIVQSGDEAIVAEVLKYPNRDDPQTAIEQLQGVAAPIAPLPPSAPAAPKTDWPILLSRLYLAGLIASCLWMLLGHLLLCRLLLRSRKPDADTSTLFASLNPDRRIRLRICDRPDRPISWGLFCPIILLPRRHLQNQTHLRHILLHELAHISQRDAFGHFLFNLLFPLLYFHPLYWWLRGRTNLARELIADDLAAAFTSREAYVADLLALAKDRLQRSAISTHALGLFESRTDFYRRMHMLVQLKAPLARQCSLYWRLGWATTLIVALVLATAALGVRRANAQVFDGEQKVADKKAADENANAATREAAIQALRAEQEQLHAQLEALEAQKRQIQAEIEKKREMDMKARIGRERIQDWIEDKQADDQKLKEKLATAKLKVAAVKENAGMEEEFFAKVGRKDPRVGERSIDFTARPQLDLVSLANSYVNAVGEMKLAELEVARFFDAHGPEHKDAKTIGAVAKIKAETAQRKVQIFRSIAEAAQEAAKADLEMAMRQVENGLAPKTAAIEAQSRLKIIQIILAQ